MNALCHRRNLPAALRAPARFLAVPLGTVCFLVSPVAAAQPRNLLPSPEATEIHVLPQNWTDEEANWFYNVAQGSKLLPYAWFLHLEQPDSQALFREANHLRALGYLPRASAAPDNPDGLPIGFVKDGQDLGLTCAACHTAQINFKGKAWLVDGAPTLANLETFQRQLVRSLEQTLNDPGKFDRFAAGVLGDGSPSPSKEQLKNQLHATLDARKSYNERNLPPPNAPGFGPGRVDALGAIMNEVASNFLHLPANAAPANAPVSYPFLWDTPQHDKVQWNGAAQNKELPFPVAGTKQVGALGRNVGEVLGVFATLDAANAGFLGLGGYPSSVNTDHLIKIEETLRELWSPQWPAELGTINPADRLLGKQLFSVNCASCHDDTFERTSPDRHVTAKMSAAGTDPLMAANFAKRWAKTGVLEGRLATVPGFRRFGTDSVVSDLLTHTVQRAILGAALQDPLHHMATDELFASAAPEYRINAELQLDNQQKLSGEFDPLNFVAINGKVREIRSREKLKLKEVGKVFFTDKSLDYPGHLFVDDGTGTKLDLAKLPHLGIASLPSGNTQLTFDQPVDISYEYKARPLNGIWATAPFLHNGSVPNLDELLKPPAKRVQRFQMGSREFDPEKVGYLVDKGEFEFDTTLPGNSNGGHDYAREFTPDERRELIAYLKSL